MWGSTAHVINSLFKYFAISIYLLIVGLSPCLSYFFLGTTIRLSEIWSSQFVILTILLCLGIFYILSRNQVATWESWVSPFFGCLFVLFQLNFCLAFIFWRFWNQKEKLQSSVDLLILALPSGYCGSPTATWLWPFEQCQS